VVHDFEPTAILTWDWKFDDNKKLVTSAGVKYSRYSTSALGWNGDAYDPRPDYYKNLPSSIFDVYDLENRNNPDFLQSNPYFLSQYNDLYNFWTSSEANRQINWDRMYYVNSVQNQNGDETLYYQERRHNNQLVLALNSTFNHNTDINNKYSLGISLNHTKGMHYKTMDDLLGGEFYYDYDKFSANEYGKGSVMNPTEAANDLRNPYKRIYKGDEAACVAPGDGYPLCLRHSLKAVRKQLGEAVAPALPSVSPEAMHPQQFSSLCILRHEYRHTANRLLELRKRLMHPRCIQPLFLPRLKRLLPQRIQRLVSHVRLIAIVNCYLFHSMINCCKVTKTF
jgi:hypothetical protein